MSERVKKKNLWEDYLESEEWKCPHAEITPSNPYGAHYWVGLNGAGLFECSYCHTKKHFNGGLSWLVTLDKVKVLAEELVEA